MHVCITAAPSTLACACQASPASLLAAENAIFAKKQYRSSFERRGREVAGSADPSSHPLLYMTSYHNFCHRRRLLEKATTGRGLHRTLKIAEAPCSEGQSQFCTAA